MYNPPLPPRQATFIIDGLNPPWLVVLYYNQSKVLARSSITKAKSFAEYALVRCSITKAKAFAEYVTRSITSRRDKQLLTY